MAKAIWAAKHAPLMSGSVFFGVFCSCTVCWTTCCLAPAALPPLFLLFQYPYPSLPVGVHWCAALFPNRSFSCLLLSSCLFLPDTFAFFFLQVYPLWDPSFPSGSTFLFSICICWSACLSFFCRNFWSVSPSIFVFLSFCFHFYPLWLRTTLSCDCVAVRTVYLRLRRLRLRLTERRRRALRAIFQGSFASWEVLVPSLFFPFPLGFFFHLTSAKWLTVAFHRKCMFWKSLIFSTLWSPIL